jgi:hypothetical protein
VKRLTLALALIGSLLFAASASAHDANSDRIPDKWEKRHGLSLKVKQTRRDQDRDGFHNRAEWRAKTDPRDADSDDDGVDDAEENAGTVTAFANGELTITLFDGGTLTGKVTEDTEIKCDKDDATTASASHDPGDDDEGDDDQGDDPGDDDEGDDDRGDWGHGDRGDDGSGKCRHGDDDGDHDNDDEECGPEALVAGAAVEEAELKISSDGRTWTEIELR